MTRLAIALVLAAACGGDDGGGFPIMPGGGGSGSSTNPDAAVDDGGDASTMIAGRVCLISDARTPTACAATGADGFTVSLDAQQATTAADGSFTLARPSGSNLVWRVTGTGIEPSAMVYSASAPATIPALTSLVYGDMLAAMQPTVGNTDGAVIARVTRGTSPVSGIVVSTSPLSTSGTYYDGASTIDWNDVATGANGVAWIPGMPAGTATLAFDTGGSNGVTMASAPVFADTITFVFHTVP